MNPIEDDPSERRHEPNGGPATPAPSHDEETRQMSEAECWQVLGRSGIGHLALRAQPVGVDIVPVNYLVNEHQVLFRSGPGTKLAELVEHPHVAFQFEKLVGGRWFSVSVKGHAERLAFDEDIEASGVMQLDSAQRGDKFNYVRIVPDAVIGRSFPENTRSTSS